MIFDAGTSKGASHSKSKHSDDSTDTDDYFNGIIRKRKISDATAVEDEEVCSSYNVSAPIEVRRSLSPRFPSKKRKSLLTLSKDATDELVFKFTSLIDVQRNQKPYFDEEETVDRIMDIMLRQSHIFVQSVGMDIDYTELVTFFQSYFKNKSGSESHHDNNVQSENVEETKTNSPEFCKDSYSKKSFTDDTKQIDDQLMKETRKLPNRAQSESKASRSGPYECPYPGCGKTFADFRGFGGHMASHSRNNRSATGIVPKFQCVICRQEFKSCQALGGHVAGHNRQKRANQKTEAGESNSEGQKSYPCDICPKTFASGQALGGHKTCHRNSADNSGVQESSDQVAQEPALLPESSDQRTSSQKPALLPDLNDTPNNLIIFFLKLFSLDFVVVFLLHY